MGRVVPKHTTQAGGDERLRGAPHGGDHGEVRIPVLVAQCPMLNAGWSVGGKLG